MKTGGRGGPTCPQDLVIAMNEALKEAELDLPCRDDKWKLNE